MKVTVLNNTEVNLVSGGDVGDHSNLNYTGSGFYNSEPGLVHVTRVSFAADAFSAFGGFVSNAFSAFASGSIYLSHPKHFR